jgi:GNAT superfamily N-acetyltransferase
MITVRPATEKDIPRILELYSQFSFQPGDYKAAPLEECRKALKKISEVPGYSLLVAEENGEVAGTLFMAILPGMAHGTSPFAVVEYMVVDEKKRRKGIGRALMEHCMKLAKEAGCYKVMLTSDKRREGAHRFYESVGFQASAHGFRYYYLR